MTTINYENKLYIVIAANGEITSYTNDYIDFDDYIQSARKHNLPFSIEQNGPNVTIARFK